MNNSIVWRILIVDDKQADDVEEIIGGSKVFTGGESAVIEKCSRFDEALARLDAGRIDLVILDLKDDSAELEDDVELPGLQVYNQIRQRRFVPIVFHTAYPNHVLDFANAFIKVVTRSDAPDVLRGAVKSIFKTGLPALIKHLEEEQRAYFWDHLDNHWKEFESEHDSSDFTYLIARRLANTLERESIRRFLVEGGYCQPLTDEAKVYPIEVYVYPPSNEVVLAGDIFKGKVGEKDGYWIVLTPSCDFAQNKAARVLIAECLALEEQQEYVNVFQTEGEPSNGAKTKLKALMSDNRDKQPERYKFLPGTFFIPNLVVDFQSLRHITADELKSMSRVASLDSPFAEALLTRFSRYYGRLGTPDLDTDYVYGKLKK